MRGQAFGPRTAIGAEGIRDEFSGRPIRRRCVASHGLDHTRSPRNFDRFASNSNLGLGFLRTIAVGLELGYRFEFRKMQAILVTIASAFGFNKRGQR